MNDVAKQPKSPKRVMHHTPITTARTNLGQIVRRAHVNGECFILEKDATPVASIMNVDDMEDWLELKNPDMRKQIAEDYAEYQCGETTSLDEFLADSGKAMTKKSTCKWPAYRMP